MAEQFITRIQCEIKEAADGSFNVTVTASNLKTRAEAKEFSEIMKDIVTANAGTEGTTLHNFLIAPKGH